jgi:thiamine phosphate synthase YjbQ (UPF0047 family)
MKVHTDYLWFNTKQRREFVRITDDVAAVVKTAAVKEGMVLVSAMHITAGVFVNDWEDGTARLRRMAGRARAGKARLSSSSDR